ncbi:MAG: N-6 DNA methylase, partial [Paludibacter sp.]
NTWDQFSAKALRKMLLEEAQLKAVISLPQGLFVSKSGQGPKTSILIFEKGGITDWTWFYKVTNDGYTMGTNRKEQKGNQLVECLTLWHEYIKHGKKPPETKNQFCIPAEWIKTLDPRVKDKIRAETRADMESKGKIDREKKEAELDKKIKAKKATEADKSMELKTFDHLLENRIQNEIAKRIDKAYNYSFNLANYKSTISDSQLVEWAVALKNIQPNGASTLEEVYKKLSNSKPENILPYLLKLNPTNALEADIAREYVSNLDNKLILEHKELNVIKEILKNGAKYPMVKLKDYLILNENKIKPNKNPEVNYKVLGVSNETGIFLNEKLQAGDTNQSYFLVEKNEFCYNPYRINVGSIALNTFDFDNQIISGAYSVFACKEDELNPKYLDALFKSKGFLDYVNDKANGGVRMNFKFEDMEAWEIPLPDIDEQDTIVTQFEKQKTIIEGSEKILKNWEVDETAFSNLPFSELDKHLNFVSSGATPLGGSNIYVQGNGVLFIRSQNVLVNKTDFSDAVQIPNEVHQKMKRTQVKKGDVFLNITGASIGRSAVMFDDRDANVNQHVAILRPNETILPEYLSAVINTPNLQKQIDKLQTGSSRQGLNFDQIRKLIVPLTDPISQLQIVENLNAQLEILNGISKMKYAAEKKINKILADVWGLEFIEPIEMEVQDGQED